MKHLSLLLALSLLMLGLGACGQSGPLYLPPPPTKTPAQLSGNSKITRPQTPYQQNQPGNNLNQTDPSEMDIFNDSDTANTSS